MKNCFNDIKDGDRYALTKVDNNFIDLPLGTVFAIKKVKTLTAWVLCPTDNVPFFTWDLSSNSSLFVVPANVRGNGEIIMYKFDRGGAVFTKLDYSSLFS